MAVIDVHSFGFTYPGAGRPAVRDITFSVESGEIFGFLGPSGAGKSTTQNVLIRLLDGYDGNVTVLGKDLRAWDIASCRRCSSERVHRRAVAATVAGIGHRASPCAELGLGLAVTSPGTRLGQKRSRMTTIGTSGDFADAAERLRLLEENVRDYAIFMTDAEGTIQTWNLGVERLLGYPEREFIRQSRGRLGPHGHLAALGMRVGSTSENVG